MKHRLVTILAMCFLVSACSIFPTTRALTEVPAATAEPQTAASVHLTLGNPSDATTDANNKDNFLMLKEQYALSFDNAKGGPNWVSWHLEASNIGGEARGDFHQDSDLPVSFKHIKKADYTNSGFDRGHLCNSKDRTDTRVNNDATFNMTNILPQAPDNNQGPWVRLEDFERKLAQDGNELYIIAGAFGTGGTGKFGGLQTIANGQVNVPSTFWKVMVILPEGENDLSRVITGTRTIAVCIPNEQGIRSTDWHTFVTTIRNVEGATGYHFLSKSSKSVRDAVETRRDSSATGPASSNPCQPEK